MDGLAHFVGSSLGSGSSAVVIATTEHLQALQDRLRSWSIDVAASAEQGRYVAVDACRMLDAFLIDGWPDEARFVETAGSAIAAAAKAAEPGQRRVSAFGEMVALLWADNRRAAAIRLEQLWNALAAQYSFNLHCAYPMSAFADAADGAALHEVCAEHLSVVPTELYTDTASEGDKRRLIVSLQQRAEALERELRRREQLEADLRQAISARDEFLSVAAHELRTPVTSLHGFAQLLLRGVSTDRQLPPDRLEAVLRTVDAQSGKLARMVTRLLDTAQIGSNKLQLSVAPADLAELVQTVVREQYAGANQSIVYLGPDHLPCTIDALRLEQVLTNLLDNALKFSPNGGAISVTLSEDGEWLRLTVADQGVGVPAEQREAIFERFHQAHASDHISGMGLGLYVTRQIVQLHGGQVRVEPGEPVGSRFVVELPRVAPSAAIPGTQA